MTKSTGGLALTRELCRALTEKKAGDIRVLDVSAISSITDYMIVATATSDPHLRALRIEMERVLDGGGNKIVGIEAPQGSGWIVVDTFNVMVHLFLPESRTKYRLEHLWKDADEIDPDKGPDKKSLKPKRGARKAPARKAPARKRKAT